MPRPPGPLFIIGSGPMIGSHTARHFATHTFTHLALFARTPAKLATDAAFITAAAPTTHITTHAVDVTDAPALTAALAAAITAHGPPEVVLYNAARIAYGTVGAYPVGDLLADFATPNLGLYTTACVLLPGLRALAAKEPDAHPCLFVTSGAIVYQPFAPVFSLGMAKSAQASLVRVLAGENEGVVHVALVTVGGRVAPEEEVCNPEGIAGKFWELWEQEKGGWEGEMRCGW